MNRVELKEKAKKMIVGNKWYIWKPIFLFSLIVGLISGALLSIIGAFGMSQTATGLVSLIVTIPCAIIESAFMVGYAKYLIDFVHDKKVDWKEPIKFVKEHWVICFLVGLVVALIIAIGTILLIVPGIIAALGLIFYLFVCAENPKLSTTEILKKSWDVTNGHKGEIFVLILSFIGWELLACLTLGILYIWLYPYMIITFTLAYESLKK